MADKRETQNFLLAQVHSGEQRHRAFEGDGLQSQPAEIMRLETSSSNAASPKMKAPHSVAGDGTASDSTANGRTPDHSTSRAISDSDDSNRTRYMGLRDNELATLAANVAQPLSRVSQLELDNRNRESQDNELLAEIDAFNGERALLIQGRGNSARNWQRYSSNMIEDPAIGQTVLLPDNDMVTTIAMIDEDASTIPTTDDNHIHIDISFKSSSFSDNSQSSIYSQEDRLQDPAQGGETMQFPRTIKYKKPTRSTLGTPSTDDHIVFADSEESSTETDENHTGGDGDFSSGADSDEAA